MYCNAMQCDVMSCHVMSCHVMSCHVMSPVRHEVVLVDLPGVGVLQVRHILVLECQLIMEIVKIHPRNSEFIVKLREREVKGIVGCHPPLTTTLDFTEELTATFGSGNGI